VRIYRINTSVKKQNQDLTLTLLYYLCPMRKLVPVLVLLAIALFTQDVLAQGCSQCKMLSEQGAELDENSFGSNINIGILYLMIIPYLLIMFLFRKRIYTFFRSLLVKE